MSDHGPVVWVGRDLHHYPVWAETEGRVLRDATPYVPRAEVDALREALRYYTERDERRLASAQSATARSRSVVRP